MDKGLLVPDELTVDLVIDRVQQEDCKNGYILDGFQEPFRRQRVWMQHWQKWEKKWILPLT